MKSSVIKWLVAIGILVVGAIVMTTLGSTEKETKKRDPKESIRKVEIQTRNCFFTITIITFLDRIKLKGTHEK